MGINHTWEYETPAAQLHCDQCGESISDGRNAIYLYEAEALNAPTYILHKGKCDQDFQLRFELKNKAMCWRDLNHLAKDLAESLGLEVKEPAASN